jgi:hypothetical protein
VQNTVPERSGKRSGTTTSERLPASHNCTVFPTVFPHSSCHRISFHQFVLLPPLTATYPAFLSSFVYPFNAWQHWQYVPQIQSLTSLPFDLQCKMTASKCNRFTPSQPLLSRLSLRFHSLFFSFVSSLLTTLFTIFYSFRTCSAATSAVLMCALIRFGHRPRWLRHLATVVRTSDVFKQPPCSSRTASYQNHSLFFFSSRMHF